MDQVQGNEEIIQQILQKNIQFQLQFKTGTLLNSSNEYINDVAITILSKEEQINGSQINKFNIGMYIIVVVARSNLIEIWNLTNLTNQFNSIKDSFLLSSTKTESKPLSCKIFHTTDYEQNQMKCKQTVIAIIGETKKQILLIDCLSGVIVRQIQDIDLSVDLQILQKNIEAPYDLVVDEFDFKEFQFANNQNNITQKSQKYQHYFITLGDGKTLRIFDIVNKKNVLTTSEMTIKGSYNCIECIDNIESNNCLYYATGDKMSCIQIWKISTNVKNGLFTATLIKKIFSTVLWLLTLAPIRLFENCYQFTSQLIACSGSFSRESSNEYNINIINWRTGQILRTIQKLHKSWINTLRTFSIVNEQDNEITNVLITGSADGNSNIIDIYTGNQLQQLEQLNMVVMHGMRLYNLSEKEKQQVKLNCNFIIVTGVNQDNQNLIKIYY